MYNGRHLPGGGPHSPPTPTSSLESSLPSPTTSAYSSTNPSPSSTPSPYARPRRSRVRIRMVQSGPFVRDSIGRNTDVDALMGAQNVYNYSYNGNGNGNGHGRGAKGKGSSGLLPTSAKDAHFAKSGAKVKYEYGYGYGNDDEDERHMQAKHLHEGRFGDTIAFAVGSVSSDFVPSLPSPSPPNSHRQSCADWTWLWLHIRGCRKTRFVAATRYAAACHLPHSSSPPTLCFILNHVCSS